MRRNKQFSEFNEHGKHVDGKYIEENDLHERTRLEQQQVEELMEHGFLWEEAVKLVKLHDHIYENEEVRQRLQEDDYMQFARWLYEQGAINEDADS